MSEKKYCLAQSSAEDKKKQLLIDDKNMHLTIDETEEKAAMEFCEDYKKFLDAAKIEREAAAETVKLAEKYGYKKFEKHTKYNAGEKLYYVNRDRAVILTTIGTAPLAEGIHISAAHIDSPRLDMKPRPLYEDEGIAYLKTHYYGGIKKYQWTAIPLALHGVVFKKDGEKVNVVIGEDENDPVFTVTDLLPHLAADQMAKLATQIVSGEQLNILLGSLPEKNTDLSDKVKLAISTLIYEKYGIIEADFMSAELTAVPAFKARDVGLDRSMIGAYGQDDRVCAYTCLMAELEVKNPKFTTLTILADKEEVGSDGTTGLASMFFVDFVEDLCDMQDVKLRHVLENSKCLSSDVNAAIDPAWANVHDKHNAARINHGTVLTKYTGSRGKSSTNDAPAETMAYFRKVFDEAGVVWQIGELGKVDQGGGGTVAKYVSQHNVDTVDLGVAVLSMHAPFEIAAKLDIYMNYRAIKAFYEAQF